MSSTNDPKRTVTSGLTRRQLLFGTGAVSLGTAAAFALSSESPLQASASDADVISFFGTHQAGIATPPQDHLVFAAFDVTAQDAASLKALLDNWSQEAASLCSTGELPAATDPSLPPADTGEAAGLGPSALTITIGYGPTLFDHRFGLEAKRPPHLAALPPFPGDDLDQSISGGDLAVQVCSTNPQAAFHAVHTLARSGLGVVALRYVQQGFGRTSAAGSSQQSARNLLGFKDGTNNLQHHETNQLREHVWIDDAGHPEFMAGGTYLVARKIRTHIEAWSASALSTQEAIVGRAKTTGAPLSGTHEHDLVDLAATDSSGQYLIATTAHIRVAAAANNGNQKILRRGYSFSDGVDQRTGELECGLYFICFQQNPLTQFGQIQGNLSTNDALSSYLRHISSAVFACPSGLARGTGWGTQLFG